MLGGVDPTVGTGQGYESGRFRLSPDNPLNRTTVQDATRRRELAQTEGRNLDEETHHAAGPRGGPNDYHLTTWRDSNGKIVAFVYVWGNDYIVLRADRQYATNLNQTLGSDDISNYVELTLHNGNKWRIRTNGIPHKVTAFDPLP